MVEEFTEAGEEVVLEFRGEVVIGDGSNHHCGRGNRFYSGEDSVLAVAKLDSVVEPWKTFQKLGLNKSGYIANGEWRGMF